ncbi:MAG: Mur ligase [Gemmatimonadaceae bacterium]|nr:Mur ligase [Gemmatimonadaceae bacterium]
MSAVSYWLRNPVTDQPEYLAPSILDSRRLFGPNFFSERAGAVLDVTCQHAAGARAVEAWPTEVRRLAAALGWTDTDCATRVSSQSASLFLTAPLDGLLTATDLSEHAWVAAEAVIAELDTPDAVPVLREKYTRERQALPHVVAIAQHAHERALSFSLDDDGCSVGSGVGVRAVVHSDTALDDSAEFDDSWDAVRDVPVALVTGSNGKTTTTRLVAAMWRANGQVTGWSCSDGVWVGADQLEAGDYTGPSGARRVLCHPRVEAAVLETARGGMLRRGLALNLVHGAVITNISADHFGEYGVETLADLAEVKSIVARALRVEAPLVLNADDPSLVVLAAQLGRAVAWFSVTNHALTHHTSPHTHAATVRDGELWLQCRGTWHTLGAVRGMPITLDGNARHNIANAAAAAVLASVVGVPVTAIRDTLASFGATASDNPGRLMIRSIGGITVVMDYAHNPDGMASLCRTAATMPASRRLLLLGQAGNRDNAQLHALAAAAWQTQRFDRVIIKEMTAMLRGRQPGEVSAVLMAALMEAGAAPDAVGMADSELSGVRDALVWSRAGDVLVLGVHVERARVLALMDQLAASGWNAGDGLPTT